VGCLILVLVLVPLVGGLVLIMLGSPSGTNDPCKNYPEDGFCSLGEMIRGFGYMLVGTAFMVIAVAVFQARRRRR
jgi:hypothetical protein